MVRILFFIIGFWTPFLASAQIFNEQGLKVMKLFSLIESYYVDSVNLDRIADAAIIESLRKLDPHSKYIPAKDAKLANEQLDGNFEGVGVSFNILNDTVVVVSIIPGGPSDKIGLLQGDRIVRVDTTCIAGVKISSKQVMQKLRGPKGSLVHVGIHRRGVAKELSFHITRDRIPLFSIDASYPIDNTTGYIKLSRFAATTKTELNEALSKMKKNHINHIILDLSGNGGGLLDMAVNMADQFLDSGKVIVYTKGLHSEQSSYISTSDGLYEKGRLVVIIDEGSASASEIFAGAIQDWDRGVIVGRRSFGKGLVQNQFRLSDGAIIRLTIARYYTPSGRLIQKPYAEGGEAYSHELTDRYKRGEFTNKDSIHFADSLKYVTNVKHRLVFGGGGIMPDIFIPLDTTYASAYSRSLIGKGIFGKFILNYLDNTRKQLYKKYPTFEKFKLNFTVDEKIMRELTEYATLQGIPLQTDEYQKSKPYLVSLVKSYLARDLWGNSAFYEIYNMTNPTFLEAIKIIKSQKFDE